MAIRLRATPPLERPQRRHQSFVGPSTDWCTPTHRRGTAQSNKTSACNGADAACTNHLRMGVPLQISIGGFRRVCKRPLAAHPLKTEPSGLAATARENTAPQSCFQWDEDKHSPVSGRSSEGSANDTHKLLRVGGFGVTATWWARTMSCRSWSVVSSDIVQPAYGAVGQPGSGRVRVRWFPPEQARGCSWPAPGKGRVSAGRTSPSAPR